jgi:hypothetical protein
MVDQFIPQSLNLSIYRVSHPRCSIERSVE